MLVRENDFERAGELFHEAIASPELWPRALQAIADACGAAGATVFPVYPEYTVAIPSPGIEEVVAALDAEGWNGTNSRMERGMALTLAGKQGFITDSDMFTSEELAVDRYYNEFVRPHRMGATAGMVLAQASGEVMFPIAMERRATDEPFGPDEIALMNPFIERLRSTATLALNLRFSAIRTVAESFSRLGDDIALIGGSGRLVYASEGFERHFGDALVNRRGRIGSWQPTVHALLSSSILKAIRNAPAIERAVEAILLPRRNHPLPLKAQLVPIAGVAQDVFALARAALIVSDPFARKERLGAQLGVVFGMSPAEARLASRIGDGEDLATIARAESISIETARKRLKAVFAKTGTHRQAELASIVAR
ncbi:MAG: helix-turn-helix transcriptional regulator, partial [Bauldia sp.]|nr:helix-turn-helix transcriptional regulator [Bauldia sp.]